MTQNIPQIIQNATVELSRRQARKQKSKKLPESELREQSEGLLYFGNPHESIPLRLLQDTYLTPKAKFAWQVIKLNAKVYQGTAFPSYEELQKLWNKKCFVVFFEHSNSKGNSNAIEFNCDIFGGISDIIIYAPDCPKNRFSG
ncbi:MAG TPA: hypothetical protein DCR57_00415 [Pasteurella multocida]|nr:hypothetical protein [Pasteurella multocida]